MKTYVAKQILRKILSKTGLVFDFLMFISLFLAYAKKRKKIGNNHFIMPRLVQNQFRNIHST